MHLRTYAIIIDGIIQRQGWQILGKDHLKITIEPRPNREVGFGARLFKISRLRRDYPTANSFVRLWLRIDAKTDTDPDPEYGQD